MQPQLNAATRRQLVGLILLDSIQQCNAAQLPQAEYELKLRALLRQRLSEDGQKELEV